MEPYKKRSFKRRMKSWFRRNKTLNFTILGILLILLIIMAFIYLSK